MILCLYDHCIQRDDWLKHLLKLIRVRKVFYNQLLSNSKEGKFISLKKKSLYLFFLNKGKKNFVFTLLLLVVFFLILINVAK